MNILIKEHMEMLLRLTKHQVDFIIIGGYAVIYYGYGRSTNDMDIWLKPDNENKKRLIKTFEEIGIIDKNINELSKINFTKPAVFSIGDEPYRIDFLTIVQGVKWDEAILKVKNLSLKDFTVPIIDYRHLITNKMLADRIKDKADIENLQKINRYRKPPFD
jgi:hypothetical protein